jgi:hypothetical protein
MQRMDDSGSTEKYYCVTGSRHSWLLWLVHLGCILYRRHCRRGWSRAEEVTPSCRPHNVDFRPVSAHGKAGRLLKVTFTSSWTFSSNICNWFWAIIRVHIGGSEQGNHVLQSDRGRNTATGSYNWRWLAICCCRWNYGESISHCCNSRHPVRLPLDLLCFILCLISSSVFLWMPRSTHFSHGVATCFRYASRLVHIKENHKFQKNGKDGSWPADPCDGLQHFVEVAKQNYNLK